MYYKVKFKEYWRICHSNWTTMPFTMVTDAMIGFNPKGDYKFLKVSRESETWIMMAEWQKC